MAYKKQTWEDRQVENPLTFTQTNNLDGSITLTPYPGAVQNEGSKMSAERFNHMENGIYDNSIRIGEIGTYSTQEGKTGKKWIDGKEIYRKVIELNNIPASTTEHPYNVENMDKIVNAQASWYDTVDMATFFSNTRYDSSNAYIKFVYLKSKFKIETKYNWSERTSNVYVIIEYTKIS